jgi:hypothetical protein
MYPKEVLFFIFLIPGIVVFGIGTRIFERTIKFNGMNFDSLENSMWCIVVTMMTVGYGDTIPASNLARGVICLSIFWGGIILSLTFVYFGSILKLNSKETSAFKAILATKESGYFICDKLIEKLAHEGNFKGWRTLSYKLRTYFEGKNYRRISQETIKYRKSVTFARHFENIDNVTDSIKVKLKKLLKEVS